MVDCLMFKIGGSMVMFTSFNAGQSDVRIQYQEHGGNWITFTVCPHQWPVIQREMKKAQYLNNPYRIRAVDEDDRVLDIL
jgi:hypothetical protein